MKMNKAGAMMKANINTIRVLVLLACIVMFLPSIVYADSKSDAVATLAEMLKAAEAENWEKYVDDYYGEQHKFRSSKDRDSLVSRFKNKWGNRVISGLREASQVKPKISDDGTRVIFQLENGKFILYKNEQGKWTFHL
jgi:hypothetical protein